MTLVTLLGSTVSATGIVPLTVPAAATVVVVVVTGRGSEEGMVTGLGDRDALAGDCLVGDDASASGCRDRKRARQTPSNNYSTG